MQELLERIRAFNKERDWDQFHSPKNLAMAMMVEAAELAEHFQWLTQAESRHPAPAVGDAVAEEIADVLIYLVTLADRLGVDPVAAAMAKISVNAKKYPVAKAKGRAHKYSALK